MFNSSTPKKRSHFVPGTYVRIPDRLLSYRLEYKQVGKNVFVVNASKPKPISKTLTAHDAITQFVAQSKPSVNNYDVTVTQLIEFLTSTDPSLHRATQEQLADYTKRKAACDDFIQKAQGKARAQRLAARKAEIDRAVRVLKSRALGLLTTEAALGVQTKPEVAENKYSEDIAKSRRAPKANAL